MNVVVISFPPRACVRWGGGGGGGGGVGVGVFCVCVCVWKIERN